MEKIKYMCCYKSIRSMAGVAETAPIQRLYENRRRLSSPMSPPPDWVGVFTALLLPTFPTDPQMNRSGKKPTSSEFDFLRYSCPIVFMPTGKLSVRWWCKNQPPIPFPHCFSRISNLKNWETRSNLDSEKWRKTKYHSLADVPIFGDEILGNSISRDRRRDILSLARKKVTGDVHFVPPGAISTTEPRKRLEERSSFSSKEKRNFTQSIDALQLTECKHY